MRLRSIALLATGLFLHTAGFSQTDPSVNVAKAEFKAKQVIPPAPEAAELGKYGNVPISLFTGTPGVSIPLFDLKGTAASLPISLSYNSGGFKPEDQATWVGSGWSLNAGGVITRAVIGNPDEQSNYFGQANILNPPDYTDKFPYFDYLTDLNNGVKEAQPDIYYYNFAGHSGKFLLRPDHSVMKKEKDGLQISKCNSCVGDAFTIIDEQGFTYIFEATETTQMIPNDGGPSQPWYNYISSWYLTAMYPPTGGETITFEYYSTGNQPANQYAKENQSFSANYLYSLTTCGALTPSGGITYSTPPVINIQRKYLKKITLQKMNVPVAYVDVVSAAGLRQDSWSGEDRQIQQVKLYSVLNGTNTLIKQYDLTQSYFTNNSNPFYKNRLRLDAVQEKGTDGTTAVKPPYQFTYNAALAMPERYTNDLDHWGFYNAANNASLVPSVTIDGGTYYGTSTVGGGANRAPSLDGCLYSMLTKIQYPTGGNTSFEYELNKGINDQPVGGLRISRMTDNAFTNKPAVVKQYSYTYDNGTSSGKAMVPEYVRSGTYHHYQQPQPPGANDCTKQDYTYNTITIASSSIYGLGSFQGSHIGYQQVTEVQTDLVTGQALGKTVNKYNIVLNEFDDDLMNGTLTEQDVYDNGGKLLQQTNNNYTPTYTDNLSSYTSKPDQNQNNKVMYCNNSSSPGTYYNYILELPPSPGTCNQWRNIPQKSFLEGHGIYQQRKLLTTQITKVYDQKSDNYITTTKEYTYGNAAVNSPTQIKETTNNNEKLFTTIKYAGDYAPTNTATGIAGNIWGLNSKNMQSTPIEKLQYRQNADGTNTRYINGQITDYATGLPLGVYVLESTAPLSTVTASAVNGSNVFTSDSHYRLAGSFGYDWNSNLSDQAKTSDMPKAYLWDYNYTYPVAEVQNATSLQIAYTSFETDYKGNFSFSGPPQAEPTSPTGRRSYSLGNGAITGNANPAATYTLSYWRNSAAGPYSVTGSTGVKQSAAHNGWTCYQHTVTGVSSVIISGSGLIDELRLYPEGALMGTATYDPIIGKTSDCGATNMISYYDYDVANRLINIRDADKNIVKNFTYHYEPNATAITGSTQTLFYNAPTQGNFTNVCTNGGTPLTSTYKVPYGRYAATTQGAADALAANDLASNGPGYAEQHGSCLFYNAYTSVTKFKNDCPEGTLGNSYQYVIPANKYSGTSAAAVQALVDADIAANAQNAANQYGTCSGGAPDCNQEGQKMINGVCETGTRYYISSVHTGNQWQCTYYYIWSDGSTSAYYSGYFPAPCRVIVVG